VRHLGPGLPRVSGDPSLLQQVFLNLVTNALDAMPQGGVLTLITAPPASGQNGYFVEVVVEDTGTGMSPEVKKKALEPFFTTKPPGEGAGLGLSICEEIIRSHHGKMEIESQEGKGSTLRIQLPVFSPEGV
jgi:signal transduction histidine kinase